MNSPIRLSSNVLTLEINKDRGCIISSLKFRENELMYINEINYRSAERPRCGCPVLFPYMGMPNNGIIIIDGVEYKAGIHGVVHTNHWILENKNSSCAVLKTASDKDSLRIFPFDFQLTSKITLIDNYITYKTKIENKSDHVMPCDIGFHPFFKISNLRNVQIIADGKTVSNDIQIQRIITDGYRMDNIKKIEIIDRATNISLELCNYDNLKNMFLWSGKPDEFLVVEPWSGVGDAINKKLTAFNIHPHEEINTEWRLKIENLKEIS